MKKIFYFFVATGVLCLSLGFFATNILAADKLDSPVKITPADGTTVTGSSVNFRWRSVAGADKYQIKVWLGDGSKKEVEEKVLNSAQKTFSLDGGKTYQWNVKACNEGSHFWDFWWWDDDCNQQEFTEPIFIVKTGEIEGPPPPLKIHPYSGQINVPLTVNLNWEEVDGAESYSIVVWYMIEDGTKRYYVTKEDEWSGSNNEKIELPYPNTTYYWNVKTCNWRKMCGDWGPTLAFKTASSEAQKEITVCEKNFADKEKVIKTADAWCDETPNPPFYFCDEKDTSYTIYCQDSFSGSMCDEERSVAIYCGVGNCKDGNCEQTPQPPPTTEIPDVPPGTTGSPGAPTDGTKTGRTTTKPIERKNCPTKGLVPCGTENCPCQFCDFFVMFNNIIKFIMINVVPVLAVLMLVVGGVMFFFAGANPGTLIRAKGIITSALIGAVIVFCAWIGVNTVLEKSRIVDPVAGKSIMEWWKIECK